jgi:hypothetical protein
VDEHVATLAATLGSPHPIRISPFGSSLSGLTDAREHAGLGWVGRAEARPPVLGPSPLASHTRLQTAPGKHTHAGSDVDLGLFGSVGGVKLEALGAKQTKELLNQVPSSTFERVGCYEH